MKLDPPWFQKVFQELDMFAVPIQRYNLHDNPRPNESNGYNISGRLPSLEEGQDRCYGETEC